MTYADFCTKAQAPLHLQPWWLDAVCGEQNWGLCLEYDKGGVAIEAALPYYKKKRWGLPFVQNPPLSSYAGPWLLYPDNPDFKRQSRYTWEKKVQKALLEQLPRSLRFQQTFRPEIGNVLPWHWAGYRSAVRYTYCLDTSAPLTQIAAGYKSTIRTNLQKADKAVFATSAAADETAATQVFQLHLQSLERQGAKAPYTAELFLRLHRALAIRQQQVAFLALDRRDQVPHAGLYLVYDERQAAMLISGTDPRFKASCAIYTLIQAAIEFCHSRQLVFDFEGSMQPAIEHTFRAFGGVLTPYFMLTKWG